MECGVQDGKFMEYVEVGRRQEIVEEDLKIGRNQSTTEVDSLGGDLSGHLSVEVAKQHHQNQVHASHQPETSELLEGIVKSEEEAYELYCKYAHNIGFSVRKDHHSYWPNSRKIKRKEFVCSKNGFKKDVALNSQRRKYQKSNVRTGCLAMIRYEVDLEGNWKVQKFIESHNHELAMAKDRHLLRSYRAVSDEKASLHKSMTHGKIRIDDAFTYLADEANCVENIGFSKSNPYNYIQKEKRSMSENGYTNSLLQLFNERQVEDNMFSWDVQIDEFGRLVNFFWVDSMGRIDYDCFGDILFLDTNCRLNKYNLVCMSLVGVNNHCQNVLFGVAFLSEETVEAFTWLFKAFIRIMDGKHPTTIFTDQIQTLARAIEVALPHTCHRLSQWHISKRILSKVLCFNSNKNVKKLFCKCLNKCDSGEEFEKSWVEMITVGGLHDNTWLEELYKIKNMWSTAFNKNCFGMGILSTQCIESTSNICHEILKPTNSVTDCFLGMEKVMMTWRQNEQVEDFNCRQSPIIPVIKSSPILKQAAIFYSRKIYSFFEEEFLNGVSGMYTECCSNDSKKFLVRSFENKDQLNPWVVFFDQNDYYIQCSCKKFETMGLLCCHCFRVLFQHNVVIIPMKYLLSRWSCRAKEDMYASQMFTNSKKKDGTSVTFRNHVSRFLYLISTRAQGNVVAEQYILAVLKDLSDKIDLILDDK